MSRTVQYAAGRGAVAVLLGLAAVFGAFAYAEAAPAGRLLLGAAAVGCAAEGLRCALVRPAVTADEQGITVVTGLRRVEVRWADVHAVTGRVDRRRGTTARSLLVDVGQTVLVVPAYRLGAPVEEVVSALEGARPR